MNIFALHKNPKIAARHHCDKHVVKMALETAQILSTVHHAVKHKVKGMYKPTHPSHRCVLWASASRANYEWLWELGVYLCKEYTYRYGKIHKSEAVIEKLKEPPPKLRGNLLYPFTMAMPAELRIEGKPITAYRNFYFRDKKRFAKWTRRPLPKWWVERME